MATQIILEQIDIMVVGPKKFQFLSLVLQKHFDYNQQTSSSESTVPPTERYTKILKKFLTISNLLTQNTSNSQSIKSTTQLPSSSKLLNQKQNEHSSSALNEQGQSVPLNLSTFCGIHKFTKMIQTQSFWLTLNFYVTDLKIYDPILSESTRGNIQIGIVVGDDQSGSIDQIKTYLSPGNQATGNLFENVKEPQKNSRTQNTIEAKVNSRIHTPCVNGFNSLLCLRLRDECRLVEQTNNLRLTNHQIFRWIVDRYFQNRYRIKLRQSLGDQIERGQLKNQQEKVGICQIM